MEKDKKKKSYKVFRIFGKILLGLIIFILLVLVFIRSPWGQGIIKDRVISSISDKTNTTIEVDRLFITFSGNIFVDGLYLEDQQGDTLVYSRELEASIPIWPIIRGNEIAINSIDWDGLKANIIREDSIQGYNFDFLVDAFAPADTTAATQDTTATQGFDLGEVDLHNFDITYRDEVTGIDSKFKLGSLHLEMDELDLENMNYRVDEASITNAEIIYHQTKAFPEQEQTEEAPLPFLSVGELELENVYANYRSVPDGISAKMDVDTFIAEVPEADLDNNQIDVDRIVLNNSVFLVETTTQDEEEGPEQQTEGEPQEFEWPEWVVTVDQISLEDNKISYFVNGANVEQGTFSANAIVLEDFDFNAADLYLQENSAGFQLQEFNFEEASGIDLDEFAMNVNFGEQALDVSNLSLHLNENRLEGELAMQYNSVEDFVNTPENAQIQAELPGFELWLDDLFLFQPELKNNEYLLALSEKSLTGDLRVNGSLSSLEITEGNFNWGSNTSLSTAGTIQNPMEPDNLQFDIPQFRFASTRADIYEFMTEEELGMRVPENLVLNGNFSGNPENIDAVADLETSEGNIELDGHFTNTDQIAFNADLEVIELQLGTILMNEQLGELNLTLTASGSGTDVNSLDAELETNISSFSYNDYEIKDLAISGDIDDGEGYITSEYKDDNLNLDLETFVQLDSVSPSFVLDLDLHGADLQALGVTSRNIRGALQLNASFEGNAESFEATAKVTEGVAVYDNQSFLLGEVNLNAFVQPDSTSLDIHNQMLDLELRSNANPQATGTAIQRHYESYLTDEVRTDTVENPVKLHLIGTITPAPILTEIFVKDLQQLDSIDIRADFDEMERTLVADVELPHINYGGNEIDSLSFHLDSDREKFEFDLGFEMISAGPLAIPETVLEGSIDNQTLFMDFNSYYNEEHLVHVQSETTSIDGTTRIHINPAEFILDSLEWSIPETNEIRISEGSMEFVDFRLSREEQQMNVTNDMPGEQKEHIGIEFDNFKLSSLLSYFNPRELLAEGNLDGEFIIEEPFGSTGLVAGLEVEDLRVIEVPLGNLRLNASAAGGDTYNFDLALKEGDVDLDLTGDYQAAETGARLDLDLALNELKMEAIEGFSQGEITNAAGSISGDMQVRGTTAEPVYEGNFSFNNADFTVAILNAGFSLEDEEFRIDNEGIYFENFVIRDQKDNELSVRGEVLTETFTNPSFDLELEANNFTILDNSTREDFDLFYGTASFDADATLTGDLDLPVLDLNLEVGSDTDITYIMPEAQVDVEEREGIVIFVNRENPDDILTETEGEEAVQLTGFEISSIISINEDAVFTIIIDEETGDNFQVTGEGDLNFDIYPNGRTTLTGRYEMTDGHYEMSLYNIVSRRFEIAEGSSVTWAGDPMDANLDVSAIYRVETSASSLMAPQISGAGVDMTSRFQQELPFLVFLNIDGELESPVISFNLDMPKTEQGAVGGQVYGRVQQLNDQENELNKQVFSLLVLNRFFPESISDGSGGGTQAIARDNLNQALSDQINMLSNQFFGETGLELDFGVESFTDYQGDTPQDRTQLDITAQQKLLDERLIVRVGSEVDLEGSPQTDRDASPIIGNVSLVYLLTEDGRFRLKGFRRNEFENVIDGQLIVSGIALIFTREFNQFHELWEQMLGGGTDQDDENNENQQPDKTEENEEKDQE